MAKAMGELQDVEAARGERSKQEKETLRDRSTKIGLPAAPSREATWRVLPAASARRRVGATAER